MTNANMHDIDSYIPKISAFDRVRFRLSAKLMAVLLKYLPSPDLLVRLAMVQLCLGRYAEAEKTFQLYLKGNPIEADPIFMYAIVLEKLGKAKTALQHYNKSISLNPKNGDAIICRDQLKQKIYGQASTDTKNNQSKAREAENKAKQSLDDGIKLVGAGKISEALAKFDRAIALKPDYAQALIERGVTLMKLNRGDDALTSLDEALTIEPDNAFAHYHLGCILQDLERLAESEASYSKAVALKPDFAGAHFNLGAVQDLQGKLEKAEASFRRSISLVPDHPITHRVLGSTLLCLGKLEEAEASFKTAISLKPDYYDAHSGLLFLKNYVESIPVSEALVAAKGYGDSVSGRANPKFTQWESKDPGTRFRIGFISGDFRTHPVGYFIENVLRNINSSMFELYAFTSTAMHDELTERIKPLFHEWTPIYTKTDFEAAEIIHQKGIHILFDLSGHTGLNRLPVFSYKPSPVQVSWLGYSGTTGLPEMDFLLGDPYVSPESESHHFTEAVWRLPESYICLTTPKEDVGVDELPAISNGFITFGSFNNPTKVTDSVVQVWSSILLSLPNSKLHLKHYIFDSPSVRNAQVGRFAAFGVTEDRLVLQGQSSRAEHFAAYNKVDIALDPFPYTGTTTSIEALWMGVPVLTLKGDRFFAHVGESIAHNTKQVDWVAADFNDYVAIAIRKANDIDSLSNLRLGLRIKLLSSPLFDAARFAHNFENALVEMWAKRYPI